MSEDCFQERINDLEEVVSAQNELIDFYDKYIAKITPYLVSHRVGPSTDEVDICEKLQLKVYKAKGF